MKIKKLKINSYGKINNKEINLKNINIIYGKNESGKSTLLNYIISMFYGISKNKNGKILSDYDRYTPWNSSDFSGNIEYELDNGREYKVYREFNKKNPEVYDNSGKDISYEFNIDKKLGNTFFVDQVKVDRDMMVSTLISSQNETEVDNSTQNLLLQKLANLADSGEEDVSYKKAIAKLDKLLLTEVGTSKSQDRPINIANQNIEKYRKEIAELKDIEALKYELEDKYAKIKNDLKIQEQNSKVYEEISEFLINNNMYLQKIDLKEGIIEENKKKIAKYMQDKDRLNKNKKNAINFTILAFIILINIVTLIFIKKPVINALIATLVPIWIGIILFKNKKNDSKNLNLQISLLEKNNNEMSNEILELEDKLKSENSKKEQELADKYGNVAISLLNDKYIEKTLRDSKKILENLSLELRKIELDMEYMEPKLEQKVELEEKLAIEESNLLKLENKSKAYGIAKKLLEDSYNQMKNSVAPRFNENLSKNVEKISNGKYKKILINEGIQVELESGRYVDIDKLSLGTIQQIYLAFRLSFIDSISDESLPIILDETFAYYDKERLEASLKFLENVENQVIIFTCTQREREILDNLKVDYNYIEL